MNLPTRLYLLAGALSIGCLFAASSEAAIPVQHLSDNDPLNEGFTLETLGFASPTVGPVNDAGTTAWQMMDDNSPVTEFGRYRFDTLTFAQEANLLVNGFFVRAKFRMVSTVSNNNPPSVYVVELNTTLNLARRFVLQWNLSSDGDPVVRGSGDGNPLVEMNGAGSGYHDWIYDYTGTANGGQGKLFMDGQFVFDWDGLADNSGPEYQFEGPSNSGTLNWNVGQLGEGNQFIPEPTSVLLLSLAGLVLLRFRQNR